MVEKPHTWMKRTFSAAGWRRALSTGITRPGKTLRRRLSKRAIEERQLRLQLAQEVGRSAQLQLRLVAEEKERDDLRDDVRREQAAHQQLKALVSPDVVATNQGAPPSFRRHLLDLRRGTRTLPALDPGAKHPLRQIPRKLRNYGLAASHSVQVPEVYKVWGSLEDLNLDDLPESFVIKSDRGAGGRGVLPLRRVDGGDFQLVGAKKTYSSDAVIRHLSHRSLGGPFFAEEILVQSGGGDLPEDIKFYMFYGEVGHVMLRRMPQHADLRQARFRFLNEEGGELPEDVCTSREVDNTIAAPAHLADFVEIARHLSRAVAVPFVRVDVYDTMRGPVFGELTRAPGGKEFYREDHDRLMGRLWDRAQFRLDLDVIDGRPLRNLYGQHQALNLYPPGYEMPGHTHGDEQEPQRVPCAAWCRHIPDEVGSPTG